MIYMNIVINDINPNNILSNNKIQKYIIYYKNISFI